MKKWQLFTRKRSKNIHAPPQKMLTTHSNFTNENWSNELEQLEKISNLNLSILLLHAALMVHTTHCILR